MHAASTLKNTEQVTEKIVQVFLEVTQSQYGMFAGIADAEEHEDTEDVKETMQNNCPFLASGDECSDGSGGTTRKRRRSDGGGGDENPRVSYMKINGQFYKDSKGGFLKRIQNLGPQFSVGKHSLLAKSLSARKPFAENNIVCKDMPAGHPPIRSFMCLPLCYQTQFVGFVSVGNGDYDRDSAVAWSKKLSPLTDAAAVILGSFRRHAHNRNVIEAYERRCETQNDLAKAKDQFLANISHELRTPLNGVIGMSQLLSDSKSINDEEKQYLGILSECAYQLVDLISDIMDYSKMAAGRFTLRHELFDLRDCVEKSYDVVALSAQEKKLNISHIIDMNVPNAYMGDAKRVKQILVNLLSNAVKFTDSGSVTTRIRVKRDQQQHHTTEDDEDDENITLLISVTDTGIGIPREKREDIFNSFTQVDSSCTRRADGAGLGLAICTKLAEMMGGRIWVDSELGSGSRFHVEIRLRIASEADFESSNLDIYSSGETSQNAAATTEGKYALIVDDKPINRKLLRQDLLKIKMVPMVCSSAEEALDFLDGNFHFDIGFIDICMPDMDGLQLAEKIKAISDFPLVALSSLGEAVEDKKKLFAMQLMKPLKRSLLYNACTRLLNNKGGDRYANVNTIRAMREQSMEHRFENYELLVVEDDRKNRIVADTLLRKIGFRNIDFAVNGKEGVDMVESHMKNGKNYDAILMDLLMPIMDGYESIKRIQKLYKLRKNSSSGKTPKIIIMTAAQTDLVTRDVIVDGVVSKPIDMKQLEKKMQSILLPQASPFA